MQIISDLTYFEIILLLTYIKVALIDGVELVKITMNIKLSSPLNIIFLLQLRQWIKNNDNLINLLRGEKTFYGQPWYIIRLCSLLFANENIYLYFKYARYILKPDKIGQEEPIGFGCDPEKRNKILFPQKKKTFLDDITPYI